MTSIEPRGIKQLLRSQIVLVAGSWGVEMGDISLRNYGLGALPSRTPLKKGGNGLSPLTPLKKGGTGEEVLRSCVSYRCAVALQLAPRWGISAGKIAEKLVLELENFQALDGQNFEVQAEVIDQGIINLGVSDRSLACWLEQLRLSPFPYRAVDPKIDPKIINYFPIQSAHARCCSLLQLAVREKVIQLEDRSLDKLSDELLASWQILVPSEIPWLDQQGEFRLVTPQEQYLVNLLVNLIDEFDSCQDSPKSQKQLQKWEKLATEISRGFANFDRYSRIFGEVRANNLPLAQARLGLVVLTRWGLERLLREYLGAIAPLEI